MNGTDIADIAFIVGMLLCWIGFVINIIIIVRKNNARCETRSPRPQIRAIIFDGDAFPVPPMPDIADIRARDEAMDDMIADYQVSVIRRVFEVDLRSAYNGERGTP